MYNWDREKCPLYEVVRCLLFRGCLSIEVNGMAVRTFRIVHYIVGVRYSGVSIKRGSTVYSMCISKGEECACTCTSSTHMCPYPPPTYMYVYVTLAPPHTHTMYCVMYV